MRVVTKKLLKDLRSKAKKSPRRRAHFLFHEFSDPVQRLVNAMEPGSYIPPHKHEKPDKIEAFVILKGKAAYIEFEDEGNIKKIHIIDEKGPKYAVDVPPRTWHTFVSLKSGTALFEIIQGPYDPKSHKNLAPWAPSEEKGSNYLEQLEERIRGHVKQKHR